MYTTKDASSAISVLIVDIATKSPPRNSRTKKTPNRPRTSPTRRNAPKLPPPPLQRHRQTQRQRVPPHGKLRQLFCRLNLKTLGPYRAPLSNLLARQRNRPRSSYGPQARQNLQPLPLKRESGLRVAKRRRLLLREKVRRRAGVVRRVIRVRERLSSTKERRLSPRRRRNLLRLLRALLVGRRRQQRQQQQQRRRMSHRRVGDR